MLHTLLSGIIGTLAFIGGLFGVQHTPSPTFEMPPVVYGSYSPSGGGTYRMGQSIGTSDTTIKLSSFKEPVSNIPYTMTYFGSDIEYGTLSPQSSVSEFISFSGVTQNGDGSATLTGVIRGMSRTPGSGGCVASTTLAQPHAGQSIFILSNPPCQLAEYAPLRTAASISAVWTFGSTTPPRYDQDLSSWIGIPGYTLVDKAYVDSVAIAGASNADQSTRGIIQIATALQIASSTKLGSTGAIVTLAASSSTSTPSVMCGLGCIVATQNNGKISPLFLNGTDSYTFNGTTTLATSTVASTTVSKVFNSMGTTSISASSATNNALILNGVPYQYPSSQGAANSVLVNNGSGVLTAGTPISQHYSLASTTGSTMAANKTVTSLPINIPAGSLTASSTIRATGHITCTDSGAGGQCDLKLIDTNGTTYVDKTITPGTSKACTMPFDITVVGVNSISSQFTVENGGCIGSTAADQSTSNTSTANWALAAGFEIQFVTQAAGGTGSTDGFIITVTP